MKTTSGGGKAFFAVLFDCYRQSGMSERLYIGGWIYFYYISIMLCPKFTTIFYTPSPLSPSNLKRRRWNVVLASKLFAMGVGDKDSSHWIY